MRTIRCNLCGKEVGGYTQDFNDDLFIHTQLGYGSKYDLCDLRFDFCSDCMDKLIDQCVIPPVVDPEEGPDVDPRYNTETYSDEEADHE